MPTPDERHPTDAPVVAPETARAGRLVDWRTDTAERLSGVLDDRTRTIPPVLVAAGDRTDPASMPEDLGEPPRAARWPLFADEAPTTTAPAAPGPSATARETPGPRGGRALTWVAAAAAVTLLAGGLGYVTDRDQQVLVASVLTPDESEAATADRPDASPRDARRSTPTDGPDEEPGRGGAGGRDDRTGERDLATLRELRRRAEPVTGVAAEAPTTARSTRDLDGAEVTFSAENLVDGESTTAWRTPGDARGTVLVLRLPRPAEITSVGAINGYAKTGRADDGSTVDWYDANRRVRRVEWFFDDGSRVVQSMRDARGMQRTPVEGVRTSTVRLRITRVSAPGSEAGGRDYTALSEVSLRGVAAPRGTAGD